MCMLCGAAATLLRTPSPRSEDPFCIKETVGQNSSTVGGSLVWVVNLDHLLGMQCVFCFDTDSCFSCSIPKMLRTTVVDLIL